MVKTGFTHEAASSDVEWYTPSKLFEAIGLRYDLDPCHPRIILPWVPCDNGYDIDANGLEQPWGGRIFMNMPYDQPELWMRLMAKACTGFDVDSGEPYDPELPFEPLYPRGGIALTYNRTDTDWFQRYGATCDALLMIKQRIKFVDATDKPRRVLRRLKGRKAVLDAPELSKAQLAQVPYLQNVLGYEWVVSSGGAGSMLMGWGDDCVQALLQASKPHAEGGSDLGACFLRAR